MLGLHLALTFSTLYLRFLEMYILFEEIHKISNVSITIKAVQFSSTSITSTAALDNLSLISLQIKF